MPEQPLLAVKNTTASKRQVTPGRIVFLASFFLLLFLIFATRSMYYERKALQIQLQSITENLQASQMVRPPNVWIGTFEDDGTFLLVEHDVQGQTKKVFGRYPITAEVKPLAAKAESLLRISWICLMLSFLTLLFGAISIAYALIMRRSHLA